MLSPHELGLYSEALFLTQIFVSRFIPPLNDVAFPAYARMQSDKDLLNRSFCRAVRLILLVACPLYLGMAVVAEPLIEILFGCNWAGMAPLVSILAASMPCYALQVLFSPALNALGLPRKTASISAMGALIMPTSFLIGVKYGVTGLALAWAFGVPLLTLATIRIAGTAMGLRFGDLLRAILPSLLSALPMTLVVFTVAAALPPMSALFRLAILVAVGFATYVTILMIFSRATVIELTLLIRGRTASA